MQRSKVFCSLGAIAISMEKLSRRIQASVTTISLGGVNWLIAVAVMLLFVQGCTYPSRMAAVPDNLTTKATVPGITNVRYWMDGDPKSLIREAQAAMVREREILVRSGHRGPVPEAEERFHEGFIQGHL